VSAVLQTAALLCTVGGLVGAALALAATRQLLVALGVLLDLLVAAGLLRLTGDPDLRALTTLAAVVLLRQLVSAGLRQGHRTAAGAER